MKKATLNLFIISITFLFGATGCWLGTCDNDSTRVCTGDGCVQCDVNECYPVYCVSDDDCNPGEYCEQLEGMCYPVSECNNDWDCPEPMVCNSTSHMCEVRTPENVCYDDWDCPDGSYCNEYSGRCEVATHCAVSSDCPEGYYCDGDTCHERPSSTCETNSECGIGAYCSEGQCVNSSTCNDNNDCQDSSAPYCDDRNTCVPDDTSSNCTISSDCPDGYQCVDGSCSAEPPRDSSWTCHFDEQCGGGICYDGRCYASCQNNSDCGTGQVCHSDGYCIDDSVIPECVANSDCAGNQVCVNGLCHESCSETDSCSNEKDFCLDGVCVPDDRAKPQCYTKSDCVNQGFDGYDCVEGICRVPCIDNGDCQACPGNPICSEGGYCVDENYVNPQCVLDSDCSDGQHCKDGACVTGR